MDEDLAIGDLGMVDPLGQILDVPEPTIENPEGVDAAVLGPGGVGATMADLGLSAGAVAMSTEEGLSGSFQGESVAMSLGADGLGFLPPVPDAPDPESPSAYSADPAPSIPSFPSAPPGEASFAQAAFVPEASSPSSMAPAVDTALGGMADPLPMVEPPAPQDPVFAGVGSTPEEMFDLEMALTPPEPAQEGFSAASDAPAAPLAPQPSVASLSAPVGLSLAMAQAISVETWAGSAAPAAATGGKGAAGASIHVENLHLPAANSNEFIDQLLGGAPDLTNADLSGWKS